MIFEYEGRDIAGDIALSRCVYEARESGRTPELSVELDDDAGLWDAWGPAPGDRVRVVEPGTADTGTLYVERVEPFSGGYALRATSLPVADAQASRTWGDTTFLAVASQLAGLVGLRVVRHGCSDMALARVCQRGEGALPVLERLCALAGCTFDAHDGALHVCSREWAESQPATGAIELSDGSEYDYRRSRPYGSCSISQRAIEGVCGGFSETYGERPPTLSVELQGLVAFPGSAELRRACAGALAYANAPLSGGYARSSSLSPFSPGAVCTVSCPDAPSAGGRAVVTRVRNDFATGASKTWWRKL